jgi:Gamma-glutamyl cyclotransferase, AIG2-like
LETPNRMTAVKSSRRVDVFFYGLFMDEDLLRAKGLHPGDAEIASLDGFALRIGQRAALVATAGARVHGVVYSLPLAEVIELYSDPTVQAYKPEAMLAQLAGGETIAVLCYNLPKPPAPNERNPEYATKLRAVAQKAGLPPDYVATIQ